MTCRVAATPDLTSSREFVFHDLDLSIRMPIGFSVCRRCGDVVTPEQYISWSCPRTAAETIPEIMRATPAAPLHGIPCALCGDPVLVDPMHRAVVEWFGATCDECFGLVEVGAR